MLTLFHAPYSRSSRIVWLLEELGADYAIHYVSIRYGDGRGGGPDAGNLHPDKKVPALDHDGAIVSDSAAVALYLCELYPTAGLAPVAGDAKRGAFLTWMSWCETEFGPAMVACLRGTADDAATASFAAAVRRLTDALARGPYLMGETFTAADVMIGAGMAYGRGAFPASEAVDAYLARITSRPALARARAKDAPVGQAAA